MKANKEVKEITIVHENPYRQGICHELFNYIRSKQKVTKRECREWLMTELGKTETEANATTTTVLSPRLDSKRGDPRGNRSAHGEEYYMEKLSRPVRFGIREPQRFRLRWREVALTPRGKSNYTPVVQDKVQMNERTLKKIVKEQAKLVRAQERIIATLQKEVV